MAGSVHRTIWWGTWLSIVVGGLAAFALVLKGLNIVIETPERVASLHKVSLVLWAEEATRGR
jgi:hypothetical protein